MAKIYETIEDLERDRLAHEMDLKAREMRSGSNSAIASLAIGVGALEVEQLTKQLAKATHSEPSKFAVYANKAIGWTGIALGAVLFGFWFSERSKLKKMKADLGALGPEDIKLPNGMTVFKAAGEDGHTGKLKQEKSAGERYV